jgi:hypothetical protein
MAEYWEAAGAAGAWETAPEGYSLGPMIDPPGLSLSEYKVSWEVRLARGHGGEFELRKGRRRREKGMGYGE